MSWMYARRSAVMPAALGLALAVSLSACSGGGNDSSSSTPKNGGTVTVGLEGESNSLLPGSTTLAMPGLIEESTIFDPLVAVAKDGSYQPYLAQLIKPNSDFTQWTVKLRPNLKFSDGTPLDAKALKEAFDKYLTASGAPTLSFLTYGDKVVKMKVVDPRTVTYVLPERDASFPQVLSQDPGRPFSVKAADAAGKNAGQKPVGAGPYMIQSWSQGNQLVLVKNPKYFRKGVVHLDKLIFKPIPDETARLNAFQSGDIQVIETARGSIMRQIKGMSDAELQVFTGDNMGGNVLNTATAPFDDLRVRKAFVEATSYDEVSDVMGEKGFSKPTTQPFSSDSPWYSEQAAKDWPKYDAAAATADLKSYIDDPKRSDGKPAGSPVAFTYQCQPTADLAEMSQTLQSEWQKVGFKVNLQNVEQAAMVGNVVGSADTKPAWVGNFQAACWRFDAEPDPSKLSTDFGPSDSVLNFTNFSSPELTQALTDLKSTDDLAKRKEAASKIADIIAQNVPEDFLGTTLQGLGFASGVHDSKKISLPGGSEGRANVAGPAIDWATLWTDQ